MRKLLILSCLLIPCSRISFAANVAASVSVTLTAMPESVAYGDPVTLVATVRSQNGAPLSRGSVTFFDGSTELGLVQVATTTSAGAGLGTATLRTVLVPLGANRITAFYAGIGTSSAAQPVMVTVTGQYPTSATLTAMRTAIGDAGDYTLTATVFAAGPVPATGSVLFNDSTISLEIGSAALNPATLQQRFTTAPAATGIPAPLVAAIADLNGDGIPDLVTGSASGLFIQLGIGDGIFQPPIQVSDASVSSQSYFHLVPGVSVVFGDFNADGDLDIAFVACNGGNCALAVLLGNGGGTFQPQRDYDQSGTIGGIGAADFNGDGISDIALANYGNGTVDLLLGNGDGTFQPPLRIPMPGASSLAAADLNGAGKFDLVVTDWNASTVNLLRNNGHGEFQPAEPLASGRNPSNITLADLRGNGRIDVVTLDSNFAVSTLLNNGDGTFQPAATAFTAGPRASLQSLAVADIRADGIPSLIVPDQATGVVDILRGNGDGTFQSPISIPTGTAPGAVAIADLNHDGRPDLAVASPESNSTIILLNQATQTATLSHALLSGSDSHAVVATYSGDARFAAKDSRPLHLAAGLAAPALDLAALPGTTISWGEPLRLRVTLTGSPALLSTRARTASYSIDHGPAATADLSTDSATVCISQLSVGSHSIIVSHAREANYSVLQAQSLTVTVTQATPVLTWSNPASIPYGTALSAVQLNATAPIAGSFAYSPAAGTALTAGAQALSVTFTPTDTTDYTSATATVSLTVNQATPAISWPTPASVPYGTALGATQLDASSPVAGVFTYTPAAGTLPPLGTQVLSVAFTPTDTVDYNSATARVKLTVTVAKPAITWAAPNPIAYGTALDTTELNATSPVAGAFVYNPAAGTVLSAGSHTLSVTFTPTDTIDYSTITSSVTQFVGPNILSQPASRTVVLGRTATFTVGATGAGPLVYQWQYWTGASWTAFASGIGLTTNSLTTFATTAAFSGLQLRALVTDANGVSAASNAATLTVSPIVTTQPAPQTVPLGSTASFIVGADGAPNLSYQWQYQSGTTWIAVSTGTGFNTATLTTLPTAATDNQTQFRVVVTDGNGLSVTSNQAKLIVAPAIITQPVGQTANDGTPAVFTVVAAGASSLGYRWQYWNGTAWATYSAGQGYNTPTLTIRTATIPLNGLQLQVVVNDSNGLSVTSNQVTLTVAPIITKQPTHQTEPVRWSATFSAVALGVPTLTYQWQYLDTTAAWQPFTNCAICNAATLITNANKLSDNGTQLRVIVTDGNGLTVTSNTVTLTVIL